ncbi:hypothetical protein SNE25_08450 [Mucilaginibacter sabulilitoris]|uniref:Uncharacterized protein n=1 Tax=Mucilaginibacter sabulilitoris TaxID=1173583 RepID=A0ABZ0TRK2_9SPHI|nr:hypothetical protein [Mucilaginibacter sabulilitoris]WPU95551.1 hypothetical protein SNE25_08450 [Mucilaginibacter sabulilitoris]
MPDNSTLLAVSAFSGLAGATLTQALSGLFTYVSDKRKYDNEVKNQYRSKKIEIAESYYFMTGETMAILKKNINYRKNRNDARSESSLKFLNEEIKKVDTHLQKLNEENWKHNLIGLYFDVTLSRNDIIAVNTMTHLLFLKNLDIADRLMKAEGEEKEGLYGLYNQSIFDLCGQYEAIYEILGNDMNLVKRELQDSFRSSQPSSRLNFR